MTQEFITIVEKARQCMEASEYDLAREHYKSASLDFRKIRSLYDKEVAPLLELLRERKDLEEKVKNSGKMLEEAENQCMMTKGGGSEYTAACVERDGAMFSYYADIRILKNFDSRLVEEWRKIII